MPCLPRCPDRPPRATALHTGVSRPLVAILATAFVVVASCSSNKMNGPAPAHYLLTIVSGNNQIATRGDTLAKPLVVMVTDSASGAPISGYSVGWGAPNLSGSIVNTTTVTDNVGTCNARWILGAKQGADTVEAQTVDPAKTLRIVTFVATGAAP